MYKIDQPKEKDYDTCISLLYQAGESFYRCSLASEPPEVFDMMKALFLRKHTLMSKEYMYLLKDENEETLGGLLVYPGSDMKKITLGMTKALGTVLKQGGLRKFLLILKRVDLKQHFPEVCSDEFFISNITVHEKHRRKGLGTILLEYAETTAKERKIPKLSLYVEVDNRPAIRAYEKFGFQIVETVMIPQKYQSYHLIGHHKMIKTV